MEKKELLLELSLVALIIFIIGCLLGITLNYIGLTHINVTSWRYWVGFSSIILPSMIVSILLKRFNIAHTSIIGRMCFFYAACITSLVVTTCILEKSIPLWPFLVGVTVFSIIYPILLFFFEHPWFKSKVDAVKQRFTSKK